MVRIMLSRTENLSTHDHLFSSHGKETIMCIVFMYMVTTVFWSELRWSWNPPLRVRWEYPGLESNPSQDINALNYSWGNLESSFNRHISDVTKEPVRNQHGDVKDMKHRQ